MNKITTDIITTTGINISKYDILPSKVFINGIEITDTGTWNKVISSIDAKDKEIDRLNNVINELEKQLINEAEKLHNISGDNFTTVGQSVYQEILDNLKELKGEKNEKD